MNVRNSSILSDLDLIKKKLGVLLLDLPRFLWNMRPGISNKPIPHWVWFKNRREKLFSTPGCQGVACDWQWTSELHLPKVFPSFGKWLYQRVLRDFPICFSESLIEKSMNGQPQVSFLIGHRGADRLPLLLQTLKSIAAQKDCSVECIVVEQDKEQRVKDHLPEWVHYIHSPPQNDHLPYSRAWAFNIAARAARSECLIFHDNDMLVPENYAKHILNYHNQGYTFINLKRFIFYLSRRHTDNIINSERLNLNFAPETVIQNLEAGGSFGANKNAYWKIGGFDERFIGWGGEDNEFWERALTKKVYPFGFLPLIHLYHAPQQEKKIGDEGNPKKLYWSLTRTPISERIQELNKKILGELNGPKCG